VGHLSQGEVKRRGTRVSQGIIPSAKELVGGETRLSEKGKGTVSEREDLRLKVSRRGGDGLYQEARSFHGWGVKRTSTRRI